MSEWINVNDRLPENGVTVLAVKELKSGQRNMALAYCIREYDHYDPVSMTHTKQPYWVCGGNNNIVYWMPLPDNRLHTTKCPIEEHYAVPLDGHCHLWEEVKRDEGTGY